MAIDPQARALIDLLTSETPPLESLDPHEARRMSDERRARSLAPPEPVAEISELQMAGPGSPLRLRLYRPTTGEPLPVIIFFHGGGWVIGGLDSHDPLCRSMANGTGALVVSVDFRLAPEDPFPAAVEDSIAATAWVVDHAADIGVDPTRVAVAGDSSGANLATVVAQQARLRGPDLAYQLLVYPVTDHDFTTSSYRENGEGFYVTIDAMRWFWGHYLTDQSDADDPRASPLRAPDLRGMPPALVITAEHDPLRDEGEEYGRRLAAAGVPTTVSRYDGMFHGFFSLGTALPAGARANEEAWAALRRALSREASIDSRR